MPSPEQVFAPWVDIGALPAPVDETSLTSVFIMVLSILVSIFIARYLWQRPRFKALRQLRRVHKQNRDPRQQLFLIRRVLQQGLQVNQLQLLVLDSEQQTDWQQFCRDLVQACYRAETPDRRTVEQFIVQARSWIKRY